MHTEKKQMTCHQLLAAEAHTLCLLSGPSGLCRRLAPQEWRSQAWAPSEGSQGREEAEQEKGDPRHPGVGECTGRGRRPAKAE